MSSYGGKIDNNMTGVYVYEVDGKWFYENREGTLTGPYDTYDAARSEWADSIVA